VRGKNQSTRTHWYPRISSGKWQDQNVRDRPLVSLVVRWSMPQVFPKRESLCLTRAGSPRSRYGDGAVWVQGERSPQVVDGPRQLPASRRLVPGAGLANNEIRRAAAPTVRCSR
jgi:hypothetical protein